MHKKLQFGGFALTLHYCTYQRTLHIFVSARRAEFERWHVRCLLWCSPGSQGL